MVAEGAVQIHGGINRSGTSRLMNFLNVDCENNERTE